MPDATVPPSVVPASTSIGSNGKYCPRSAKAAAMSRTGVPASAVKVNSVGSYSTMPFRLVVEILTADTADKRGLVPAPTAMTQGAERTASTSSMTLPGVRVGFIRGR